MQWNIGASAAMSLDASANLGIGTTSPAAKLQLNTGAVGTVGQIIQMFASQTADALRITRSDSNLSLQFTPTGQLSIGDIASPASTVITTGPSTSTNANLKVTGSNVGNPNLFLQSSNGGGGSLGGPTSFVYFGDNNRALSYIGGTKNNASGATASSDLVFGTTSDISTTAVTERMRIDLSGNLLVGGTAARGTTVGAAHLDLFNGTAPVGTLTNGVSLYSSSGDLKFMNAAGEAFDVGYRNIPQNAQTGSYTLTLADSGDHIYHALGAAAATYTIPANGSVAYPIGTAITFVNMAAANVTIAITTDTMYLSSAGTTGSRTLAQYGSATAIKLTSTTWLISGSGLT
jgi:hypothetical protein